MHAFPKKFFVFGLAAAVAGLVPNAVSAQECTAEVSPAAIPAGSAAAQVTLSLSGEVGPITELGESDSGITLADPADLPRTDMAAETAPTPIQMSGQNVWQLWLDTREAEAGDHEFEVVGATGTCTATLTIQPAG